MNSELKDMRDSLGQFLKEVFAWVADTLIFVATCFGVAFSIDLFCGISTGKFEGLVELQKNTGQSLLLHGVYGFFTALMPVFILMIFCGRDVALRDLSNKKWSIRIFAALYISMAIVALGLCFGEPIKSKSVGVGIITYIVLGIAFLKAPGNGRGVVSGVEPSTYEEMQNQARRK